MRPIFVRCLTGLIAMACLALAAQAAPAQSMIMTVSSVDEALSDARYVLKLAGREDLTKQMDAFLAGINNGKGLAGIDTRKPMGTYLIGSVENLMDSPPSVAFVPISNQDDFLGLLKSFDVKQDKFEMDILKLTGPNEEVMYLRFAHQHAFASDKPELLQKKLPVPAKLIPAGHQGKLMAFSIRFDSLSPQFKKEMIEELKKGLTASAELAPGETEAESKLAAEVGKWFTEGIIQFVEDWQDLTYVLDIDRRRDRFVMDWSFSAKEGTPTQAAFKRFGQGRSRFSALARDSMFSYLLTMPVGEKLLNLYAQLAEQGLAAETDPAKKEAAKKALKILLPMIKSFDTMDQAVFVRGPFEDKSYAMVMGMRLKNAKKLEKQMLALLPDLPKESRGEVKINHTRIGDIDVHLIQSKEIDDSVPETFGSKEMYVACGKDFVLITMGKNGLKEMKTALARLKEKPAKDVAPIQVEVSLRRMVEAFAPEDDMYARSILDLFTGANQNKDKVRVSIEGGNGIHLRLEVTTYLLKLIGENLPFTNLVETE